MTDTDIPKMLRRTLRLLTAYVVVIATVVAAGVLFVWREEARTHSALCTFDADLNRRADAAHQFLHDHPHGIPGITAAVIRRNLKVQESTLHALRGLNCE